MNSSTSPTRNETLHTLTGNWMDVSKAVLTLWFFEFQTGGCPRKHFFAPKLILKQKQSCDSPDHVVPYPQIGESSSEGRNGEEGTLF